MVGLVLLGKEVSLITGLDNGGIEIYRRMFTVAVDDSIYLLCLQSSYPPYSLYQQVLHAYFLVWYHDVMVRKWALSQDSLDSSAAIKQLMTSYSTLHGGHEHLSNYMQLCTFTVHFQFSFYHFIFHFAVPPLEKKYVNIYTYKFLPPYYNNFRY